MQHQSANAATSHIAIEVGVAVLVVAGNFVSLRLAVHAYLMRTTGDEFHPDYAVLFAGLQQLHPSLRRFS